MKKELFVKALKYLNAIYPTFKLDTNDSYVIEAWYDVLKEYDDTYFSELLRDYAKDNIYAPNSPAHLIDYAKKRVLNNLDSNGVFEKLITRIRDNSYHLDEVIKKYENGGQEVIAKTIKELHSNFMLWFSDAQQISYLKHNFTEAYARNMQNQINKDARLGNIDETKLLGNGE
jgi:hypothetical protein